MSADFKVCPECGRDLSLVDIQAHADDHWPVPLDDRKAHQRTAILRRGILLQGGTSYAEYLDRDRLFTVR